MCSRKNSLSNKETLDKIREAYINQTQPNVSALAREFGFPYSKLREIVKNQNWNQYRLNGNEKTEIKGGETHPTDTPIKLHEKGAACSDFSNSHDSSAKADSPLDEKEEIEQLRRRAFSLASKAADSVAKTKSYTPKEWDVLVGTYVKIIGAQAKIAGLEDGIDRLISELTQQDVFCKPSGFEEGSNDDN